MSACRIDLSTISEVQQRPDCIAGTRRRHTDESIWPEAPCEAHSLKPERPGKLRLMLQAEECQRRADECALLADATVNPILLARYRHLEASWRYLVRLKTRTEPPAPARALGT